VAPHIGDMMQVHLQLALAHPACVVLEYIPWTLECFQEPATVAGGQFRTAGAARRGNGAAHRRHLAVRSPAPMLSWVGIVA